MNKTNKKIMLISNSFEFLWTARIELINNLKLYGYEILVVAEKDSYVEDFKEENIQVIEWKIKGQSKNIFHEFVSFLDLRKIIKNEKPDIVFNFTIKPIIYASINKFLICHNFLLISMIAGFGNSFSFKKKYFNPIAFLFKHSLIKNDLLIAQNEDDKALLLKWCRHKNTKVIKINGSGVNLDKFKPDHDQETPYQFILASRLMKEKGVEEYLEAADIIKDKNKDITFILAGGCDDPNLLKKIQKSHSRGTINYIGHTKNIKSYIIKTMVVVLPSYYFEGVPRILLEALALDKPIITTNWRGCRDTVVHNYNGRLIDIKNTNSLIESMNYFLEDSNLVSKMVGRSRKLAEEKFDRDKVNNKITENINKL